MSIVQFLRIIWARRLLILATMICCVAGGAFVALRAPPRWEAHTRVLLGLLKPDPLTGQLLSSSSARDYVATQVELVTDYSVAGQVADALGWTTNPALISAYNHRHKGDTRDFRHWAADIVIGSTKVNVLQDSNIMEISYTAQSAEEAKVIVDALRQAFIDQSLAFRRADAARNADWFVNESIKAKALLDSAEAAKADYERENGILMQDNTTDVDSARLRSLTLQASAPSVNIAAQGSSAASVELAQIDAQIEQASRTLGVNHPELQALRARRSAIAELVARDQAAARAAVSANASGSGALDRAIQAQKSRVLAQRDKVARLQQLQSDVDLRRDQYTRAQTRAAQLREEAAVADTGLTPLGSATTPQRPIFPNKPLIIGGSGFLGLALGLLAGLLAELLARRVRGAEDLHAILDVPILAIIPAGSGAWPKPLMRARERMEPAVKFGVADA